MRKLFDVAKTICNINGWNITNLQLQKMLYIVQMLFVGVRKGEPLFNAHFEAWKYGPVEPTLYSKLKPFCSEMLPLWAFSDDDSIPENDPDFIILKKIIDTLNKKTINFLITYTHDDKGAWHKIYTDEREAGTGNYKFLPISIKDILDEHSRRFQ